MILDNLNRLEFYSSLNPHFEKVHDFFQDNDLMDMADGRYEIDGDNAYVMIGDHNLKTEADATTEAHDKYIDIQIVLRGSETHGWIDREECASVREVKPEKDLTFFNDRPTDMISLSAGQMVIFFPWDGHAPLIGEGTARKAIVKVAVK